MRYDTICISASFDILCGREGVFFKGYKKNKSIRRVEQFYTGVYDLYSYEGELIFGGFNEFRYFEGTNESDVEIYMFLIGKKMLIEDGYWEDEKYYDIEEKGKWVLFEKCINGELKIPFKTCHDSRTFRGYLVKTYNEKFVRQWNQTNYYPADVLEEKWTKDDYFELVPTYNLPHLILFDKIEVIKDNYAIVRKKGKYYRIDFSYQDISKGYDYIEIINNKFSFILDGYYLGLLRFSKEIVQCKYEFITNPVDNKCFLFRTYPDYPGSKYRNKYFAIYVDLDQNNNFEYKIVDQTKIIKPIDYDRLRQLLDDNVFVLRESTDKKQIPIYIKDKYRSAFHKNIIDKTLKSNKKIDKSLHNDYYECSYLLNERITKYNSDSCRYTYEDSLYDALDGEMDAYWNID